jgi:hypothetical protein
VYDLGNSPIVKDSNRRQHRRTPARLRAWADPGGLAPVIDCLVVDVSESGASIVALSGGELPDAFHLQLDAKQTLGKAEVRWRNGAAAGVLLAKPTTR